MGLHFLAMGYFIPFPPFAIIAWLLLRRSATGAAVRQPDGAILAGLAATLALWAASASTSAFALTLKPDNAA
jgi:hypothetical protein